MKVIIYKDLFVLTIENQFWLPKAISIVKWQLWPLQIIYYQFQQTMWINGSFDQFVQETRFDRKMAGKEMNKTY